MTIINDERSEINEAMTNPYKFKALSDDKRLEVLFEDVIVNGNINKSNYDIWAKESASEAVTDDFKVKLIIKFLESNPDKERMESIINTKLLEGCLPKLFTKIDKNLTINLNLYKANIQKAKGDGMDKFILLLTIFPVKAALEVLEALDIEEDKTIMTEAISKLDDFLIINERDSLKRFILENGMELYEYMYSVSGNMVRVYEVPKYRYLTKKYLLEDIERLKDPIFPEDLKISSDDLIESGITDKDGADEMMFMLAEHLINKPYKNDKEILLKTARDFSKHKFFRTFRRVKWIK